MSGITLTEVLDTTIPTPPTGKVTIFADDTDGPSFKDDTGTVIPFQGVPGEGVPTGGAAGEVLAKIDGADYNTHWVAVGSGDVVGPASSTNNVVAVYDGTTGKLLKDGATYVGQTSITTLGTIATGTWNATAISAVKGGTGQAVYAVGDLLYASTTTALSKLSVGTNGQILTLVAGVPSWATPAGGGDVVGPASSVDNTLPRFDSTTGKLLQTSGVIVGDNNEISGYRGNLNQQTGTSYTLVAADTGKIVELTNASAIALTADPALPVGFACTIVQGGAGQVTIASTGSGTVVNRQSHTKTAGQNAMCAVYVRSNSGSNAVFVLGGDTAA